MKNGKFVVAYLLSGLGDSFSKDLELGAMQRAEEENVNLILFPGKFIDRELPDEIKYEYQYNTLFDLVIEDNVDAVIIAADCIGCFAARERISAFIKRYSEIPCVLAACREEGKSSISYDNAKGIEEGINYLIDAKNCTRFAMLGGPISNTDARERKETLLRVLKSRDIPFDESVNYVEGTLNRDSVPYAAELLDKNPDVQAIFCVNDEVAVALYQAMNERGLIPGRDIYVLGYDNSPLAGQMRPTLSSIWADPTELSRQAFDMALNLIRGRKTPSRSLDTMLVKRDSFGDETEHVELADMDKDQIKALYNKVFYRLQGARGVEFKAYQKVIKDCMELIVAEGYEPELHERLKGHFLEMLDTGILKYADMELMQGAMDDIYARISEGEGRRKDRNEVRQGFSDIYRMIVSYQQETIRSIVETDAAIDYSLKMAAQDIMQFENGYDQNYSVPLKKLPYIGIQNAYLYLLKRPIVHLDGEQLSTPEELYLKVVLKNGETKNITAPHQKVSIYDIYCNDYMGDERFSMAMLPLYSTDELYGYLLCDISEQVINNSEMLVNQLSAAYRMLYVLGRTQDIMDQLEQSNETLKRHNIILDNLSKADQMTGIYNRRGFYEAAEACLAGAEATDIPVMVMYVDMDNLKIVNDRYGHDDGDFALKHIASTLRDIIDKEKGVIGRLGGDEFACIVWTDMEPQDFKHMIRERFDSFNRTSDKPYNITVSVGIYKLAGEHKSLEEALALADDDLYMEKKKRSKKIVKK